MPLGRLHEVCAIGREIKDELSAGAFGFALAGNDTSGTRERILGIKTIGPKRTGVNNQDAKGRSSAGLPDRIILKSAQWGLPAGTTFRLFDLKLQGEAPLTDAYDIALADSKAGILGTYPDGARRTARPSTQPRLGASLPHFRAFGDGNLGLGRCAGHPVLQEEDIPVASEKRGNLFRFSQTPLLPPPQFRSLHALRGRYRRKTQRARSQALE